MDFLTQFDAVSVAMLTFAVVGFVKLYASVVDGDWKTAGKIAVAAVAGAVLAPFAGEFTWFAGLLIGFNASGVVTAVSYFGSK